MNSKVSQTELNQINNYKGIINNDEKLNEIEKLIEENKIKGNKIPLNIILILIYYKSKKNSLKTSEISSLVKKEVINNKDVIISSLDPNYFILDKSNYRKGIKNIIKNKKLLIGNINESIEKEYILKINEVPSIITKFINFFQNVDNYKSLPINKKENSDKNILDQFEGNNTDEEKNSSTSREITVEENSSPSFKKIRYPKYIKNMEKNDESPEYISNKKSEKYITFIQNDKGNIFNTIECKIENENKVNNSILSPKSLSKKRKTSKNKNNQSNKPKMEMNYKNTNSTIEKKLDISGKQIEREYAQKDLKIDEEAENIDSIINTGELFLSFLKKKKLFELNSNDKNSLGDGIKNINYNLNGITQKGNDININNEPQEIEKEVNELKLLNKKYKKKIGLLLAYKMSPENKELYEKLISDILIICKDYKNNEALLKMLLINEKDNNKIKSINNDDYGNRGLNTNILNNNFINDNNLKNNINYNLKEDFVKEVIKLESSESDTQSCLEQSFSFKTIQ